MSSRPKRSAACAIAARRPSLSITSTPTGSAPRPISSIALADRSRALRVDVEDRDVGAELRQTESDALADAASGSGDDRGLPGEQDVGRIQHGVERVARDLDCFVLVHAWRRLPWSGAG